MTWEDFHFHLLVLEVNLKMGFCNYWKVLDFILEVENHFKETKVQVYSCWSFGQKLTKRKMVEEVVNFMEDLKNLKTKFSFGIIEEAGFVKRASKQRINFSITFPFTFMTKSHLIYFAKPLIKNYGRRILKPDRPSQWRQMYCQLHESKSRAQMHCSWHK